MNRITPTSSTQKVQDEHTDKAKRQQDIKPGEQGPKMAREFTIRSFSICAAASNGIEFRYS